MEIAFPPLHPLIVHAAVVLLPLAAIGALVIVVWGRARERYGSLVAVGAIAAAGAVIGARLSGEVLAGATTGTGTLGAHMFWGLIAPWPAAALAVAVTGFVLVARRAGTAAAAGSPAGQTRTVLQTVLAIVTAVAAVVSIAVVVVTGHLGATAVWVG
jgi:hypothetical protein